MTVGDAERAMPVLAVHAEPDAPHSMLAAETLGDHDDRQRRGHDSSPQGGRDLLRVSAGPPTAIEYAAELAVRYHDEQRARIDGRSFAKPAFKCGPPENARSWALLVDEFFGGADLVPPCGH